MNTRIGKSSSSGKRSLAKATVLSLAGGAVLAAALFIANNQPWGYVAPPALSGINFKSGNVIAYTPWFETGTFRGELQALPVDSDGSVVMLTAEWTASTVLDGQHFLTGRRIVTTDGSGSGIPFLFNSLTVEQKVAVGSNPILDYVRGDRSKEGENQMRVRSSVLGDIVHSGPVYVGKSVAGYGFDDYLDFAKDNVNRAGRVYVGANDGMLHAFDASDGSEVFAYVPSMVIGNLPKLAEQPYDHQYFVDGFLTVGDAQFGSDWHSVLVGGLSAGGIGYYGLDVTDPAAASENQAVDKILWEFHSTSTGADNLGYSYSRPSIVRLNDSGQWGAVVGNGYLSPAGVASLYVIDIETGDVIKELVVAGGADNGLSSPTVIDADDDGVVDAAYAGDLNGNLWKFELGPSGSSTWSVAYGGLPLFQTATGQAITTAPEVGRHPEGGRMVYIATGRLLSASDGLDKTTQAVYGLWDNDWANGVPISSDALVKQQLKSVFHDVAGATRVATDNRPDWSSKRGWMTPTEITGASTLDQGERVLQDILLRDGRVSFMSINPTVGTGDNWFIQLDALSGGAPDKTIIDINDDNKLDVVDNVDGNGDGNVGDVREDRIVGQYQSFGLVSRPVLGILGPSSDAALINHLSAIPPNLVFDPDDPGLLGGHFDLDTSSNIYDFDTGVTDGHVHEWDDTHNLTSIDYMNLPDGSGNPLFEINSDVYGKGQDGSPVDGMDKDAIFILTVANTELSPGGVLEINSTSISVSEYAALLDLYLQGNLNEGWNNGPLFKLNQPTDAEVAAGVKQLKSLKLSFDAFAILSGDLVPSVTGCVRKNNRGQQGEYRNGALMVQALDASDISGGFVEDEALELWVAGSTSIHTELGYADRGLFWESTVFWHWDGPCYSDPAWSPLYESCIVQGGGECLANSDEQKKKGKKKKKKKGDDEEEVPPSTDDSPEPGVEMDPGQSVTNTTIGGSNETGRLYWKELIPEE